MPSTQFSRRLAVAVLLIGCVLALSPPLQAAGLERTMRGADLNITLDTRWAGCSHGGYYPVRLRVTNLGPARNVRFDFRPSDDGVPRVFRDLRLEQNATMQFSLSVPLVGQNAHGLLSVVVDGQRVESLQTTVSLADSDGSAYDRPAMLVISPTSETVDEFEEGVNVLASAAMASGGSYGYYYGVARSSDHEVISPMMLPERWIDYTGLDFVALPLDVLDKIPAAARQALLGWSRAGGNLIVYNVGEDPARSEKLARLLDLGPESGAEGSDWSRPTPERRRHVASVDIDELRGYSTFSGTAEEIGETPAQPPSEQGFAWKGDAQAFAYRPNLQGTVIAFPENPFPGSRHDWVWLLETLAPARYKWTERYGMSARHGNSDFLEFLIPGLGGVPVVAFLVLITFFTILIGPLNYYLLAKRRRLYLLVLTIPIIAFATSVSLFAYSMLAHGFSTKSRVRSLTVVDQRLQKAITNSRISLYSGLAPSEGLAFSPETAVFPVWPQYGEETFQTGEVNWTDQQALTLGWLKSRTRTQFTTTEYRDERGRLQIEPTTDGELRVSNGFETGFQQLLVADAAGDLYFAADVDAGKSALLHRATPEELKLLSEFLSEHAPRIPDQMQQYGSVYDNRYDYYPSESAAEFSTALEKSLPERTLQRAAATPKELLRPRSYFAVFDGNPGVTVGYESTDEVVGLHALLGYY